MVSLVTGVRVDFDHEQSAMVVYAETTEGQWFWVATVDVGPFDTFLDAWHAVARAMLRSGAVAQLV